MHMGSFYSLKTWNDANGDAIVAVCYDVINARQRNQAPCSHSGLGNREDGNTRYDEDDLSDPTNIDDSDDDRVMIHCFRFLIFSQ